MDNIKREREREYITIKNTVTYYILTCGNQPKINKKKKKKRKKGEERRGEGEKVLQDRKKGRMWVMNDGIEIV